MSADEADLAFDRYRRRSRPEDLARVFELCAPQLLLLAQHVAGQPGVAEDLVQSTFLRAIEAAHRFEPGRPVMPWLVGILVREARKHRRQERRVPDPERLGATEAAVPHEVAEMREFRDALLEAIDALPQAYREVLTLRLIHGLTPTEIAHARGVSPDTVKTQLRRGSERLRARLPAGFAAATAVVLGLTPCLSTMRAAVLSAAEAAQLAAPTVCAPAAAVGTSVARVAARPGARWLAAAAVVAAGAAAVWSFGGDGAGDERPVRREVIVAQKPPVPEATPPRAVAIGAHSAPAETAAPQPGLVSFVGRVLDDSGSVEPDVRVELLRLHVDALVVEASTPPAWTTAPPLVAGASTDVTGRFSIEGMPPWGLFVVRIDAGGERERLILIDRTPAPRAEVDLGDVTLGRRRVLRGRVIDSLGRPIEGARLRRAGAAWRAPNDGGLGICGVVLERACDSGFDPDGAFAVRCARSWQVLPVPAWAKELYARLGREIETGADGRFEWVTSRESIELDVRAPGYRAEKLCEQLSQDLRDVGNVALRAARAVRCQVFDALGSPVAGAEVLLGSRGPEDESALMRPVGQTREDGDLDAFWPGGEPVFAAVRRGPGEPWFVTDPRPTNWPLRVRLPSTFDVFVRVIDSVGRPIVSPSVRLLPGELVDQAGPGILAMHQLGFVEPLDLSARLSRPDPGVVHVADVPSGEWILIVGSRSCAPRALEVSIAGRTDRVVELADLESTAVAVDDVGFRAQPDLPVLVRSVGQRDAVHEFPVLVGRTDDEGALAIARSRWSGLAVSTAQAEGGWLHGRARPGTAQLDLTMTARGGLAGRLTDGGAVPEGAWIVCATRDLDAPAIGAPPVLSPVGDDGAFSFDALEPGAWIVRALRRPARFDAPGHVLSVLFADPSGPEHRVEVLPGGLARLVFDVRPPADETDAGEPERTTLYGTLSIDGQPGVGYRILVEHRGGWTSLAVDGTGRFDSDLDPALAARLAVVDARAADGGLPDEYSWLSRPVFEAGVPPALDIDLKLEPLTCILSTAGGARAGLVEVVLEGVLDPGAAGSTATSRFRARADDSGWFECPNLPAGRYRMSVADPAHGWLERDVQVGPSRATVGMSVTLNPLLRASGVASARKIGVALPTGSRVDFVRTDASGPRLVRKGAIGPRGAFEVERLLPGDYEMTVRASVVVSGPGGGFVVIPPERSGIVVPQGTVRVVDRDVGGIVLERRAR